MLGAVEGCWRLFLYQRFTPDNAQKWLRATAFGSAMLASSAMNNVFVTYSSDFFKNVAKVTPAWFIVGQLIYLIFNAANDTVFGWLSDRLPVKGDGKGGPAVNLTLLRRQRALRWGGIAWSLAFALAWFPWASGTPALGAPGSDAEAWHSAALRGLHFILALCAYDGALTYVEVNHAAVLAEMTRNASERADANMMSAVGAAIGSFTSILAHSLYDRQDMTAFRMMAVLIAILSILVFQFSATGVAWDGKALKASLAASQAPMMVIKTTSPTNASAMVASGSGGSLSSLSSSSSTSNHAFTEVVADSGSSPSSASAPVLALSSRRRTALISPAIGQDGSFSKKRKQQSKGGSGNNSVSYLLFLKQLLSSRNILVFIVLSTIQTFDCSFEKGFLAPFSDIVVSAADAKIRLNEAALLQQQQQQQQLQLPKPALSISDQMQTAPVLPLGEAVVSKHTRSIIISLSFLLPHVLTLVWTPLVTGWGMHRTIITILVLRGILLAGAGFVHGLEPSQSAISASTALGFMLANRVLSESVCRLSPLILSDLIDEDTVLHRRSLTLSASVVGTAAMFSKASQSLAPLVAFHVLPDDLGHLLSIAPLDDDENGGDGSAGSDNSNSNSPGHGGGAASSDANGENGLKGLLQKQILKAATLIERGEERALDELMPLEGVEEAADGDERQEPKQGEHSNKKKSDADELVDEAVVKAVLPDLSASSSPTLSLSRRRAAASSFSSASASASVSSLSQLEAKAKPLFKASTRVWTLLLALPSVAVFLQLLVWTRGYTLHGKRLAKIKAEADQLAASTPLPAAVGELQDDNDDGDNDNDEEEANTDDASGGKPRRRAGHSSSASGSADAGSSGSGAGVIAL